MTIVFSLDLWKWSSSDVFTPYHSSVSNPGVKIRIMELGSRWNQIFHRVLKLRMTAWYTTKNCPLVKGYFFPLWLFYNNIKTFMKCLSPQNLRCPFWGHCLLFNYWNNQRKNKQVLTSQWKIYSPPPPISLVQSVLIYAICIKIPFLA